MTALRSLPARGARRAGGRLLSGASGVGVLATVVLAAVVVALVLVQYVGLGAARRLGLVATPQRFTQLSFEHPDRLPSSVTPGRPLSLGFAIADHEGRRVTYHWSVTIAGGSTPAQLAAGATTVASSQSRDVAVVVRLPRFVKGPATVLVALASPAEAISLHVDAP